MPLYEYQCDACGREFELIRKFSDPPLEKCPHCGGTVRKLFSSPAIQFKGSGFYITDYAKKDQAPSSTSGESQADTASQDKDTGEKSERAEKKEKAEKSDKTENSDKSEKTGKRDKASTDSKTAAKTDATTASPSKPAPKDGT